MDNLLQQGITAAKAGDKPQAFQLLTRATQDQASAEQAWLWLSGVVEQGEERLFCLGSALRINPNNEHAKRAANALRQNGILPASPTLPRTAKSAVPSTLAQALTPPISPQSVSVAQPAKNAAQSLEAISSLPSPAEERKRQEMAGLYKFAAAELAQKKLPKVIVKELINRGVSPDVASKIVDEIQQVFRKARGEKCRKQMTRGFLWSVVGSMITCMTYVFASNLGG